MTTLRKAAQQALEVMESLHRTGDTQVFDMYGREATEALRAALAEPVEYAVEPNGKRSPLLTHMMNKRTKEDTTLAEPVQEPVAHSVVAGALFDFMGWLTSRRERIVLSSADNASPAVEAITEFAKMRGLSLDDAKVQDWNTAPPQRKPLTDEEMKRVCVEAWSFDPYEIARAIERAHGIKENS
tara:strand:+ start:1522 stop:2073 length:552 start_codon:yes stop_codon:yes gene_type:complete